MPCAGEYYTMIFTLETVSRKRVGNAMAVTLRQVAQLAGVSLSTASRVINNRPGVKPEVREHVWRIIQQYDYIPNQEARLLASHRSRKVPSSS